MKAQSIKLGIKLKGWFTMDEFKEFADLLRDLILKYIDKIDLDSLPKVPLPDASDKNEDHQCGHGSYYLHLDNTLYIKNDSKPTQEE